MMVYDYTLTFSSEVDLFWKRKFGSVATALFYFNRYLLLFVCISKTAFFWDALVSGTLLCFGMPLAPTR